MDIFGGRSTQRFLYQHILLTIICLFLLLLSSSRRRHPLYSLFITPLPPPSFQNDVSSNSTTIPRNPPLAFPSLFGIFGINFAKNNKICADAGDKQSDDEDCIMLSGDESEGEDDGSVGVSTFTSLPLLIVLGTGASLGFCPNPRKSSHSHSYLTLTFSTPITSQFPST